MVSDYDDNSSHLQARMRERSVPIHIRARLAAAEELATATAELVKRINPEPGKGVCVMDHDAPLPRVRMALFVWKEASK